MTNENFILPNFFSINKGGICICTSGSMEVMIDDKYLKLTKGMTFFISPIINYQVLAISDDFNSIKIIAPITYLYPVFKRVARIIILFRVKSEPYLSLTENQIEEFKIRKEKIDRIEMQLSSDIDETDKQILQIQLELTLQECLLNFLLYYKKQHGIPSTQTTVSENILFQFLFSLIIEYKKERSVSYYARKVNLSQGHFSLLVKEATGHTPSELISMFTIMGAKELLTNTSKSIKEIAEELDFPEQFTFRKYFKHYTGLSPKEFRTKQREQ